jgi:UDP-N-acetylmuramoyl-tripeptide--D-alanyl-D-alanine ligase
MRFSLDDLLAATGGRLAVPTVRRPALDLITGVSTDTRTLRPGDLFVALRGPRADGHTFVREAFRKGAAAALVSQTVNHLPDGAPVIQVADGLRALAGLATAYRRTLPVTIVGVTGSVGKTTTTGMCTAVLATRFAVARTKDDWNAEIGVPLTVLALEPTHEVAVIEMGMRGLGQIADLVEITRPRIGVVTSIGESHLELLGTIEKVAQAKGELIAGLPADGVAVLNADDQRVADLARRSRARVLTYGLRRPADIRASEIIFSPRGMRFRIDGQGSRIAITLDAWGRHNVGNALAAAAVGLTMGLDLGAVRDGLAAYTPPKMRLVPVQVGDMLIIDDAYNASPTSMEAAFEVLEVAAKDRRMVAILGEMKELGPHSPQMHHDVGRHLARRPVALLVTVTDGGRAIADGAAAGGMRRDAIVHFATMDEAVRRVPDLVRPGDVVLVKGSRASAMERIVEALTRALRSSDARHHTRES